MSADVFDLVKGNPMPADFPGILRELADRVERGEVGAFVGCYHDGDRYEFLYPSSLNDSLVLASLLQHRTCAKYGVGQP